MVANHGHTSVLGVTTTLRDDSDHFESAKNPPRVRRQTRKASDYIPKPDALLNALSLEVLPIHFSAFPAGPHHRHAPTTAVSDHFDDRDF